MSSRKPIKRSCLLLFTLLVLLLAILACNEAGAPTAVAELETSKPTQNLPTESLKLVIRPTSTSATTSGKPSSIPEQTSPSPLTSPTSTYSVHVIQAGETLSGIAKQFGVSLEDLVAANDIADPSLIKVGQELVIPTSGATITQAEPTVTDALISADMPVEELPDEDKALIIEASLVSDGAIVVKEIRIGREKDKETILVVIETQGGRGSIADETTMKEATACFIHAYEGNKQLEIRAKYVLVQAKNHFGDDKWYAVAAIDDIMLLMNGEITTSEFVERARIETP